MGEVVSPAVVTGLAAISIRLEITFMPGFHSISKLSHCAAELGSAWRLILKRTVFVAGVAIAALSTDMFEPSPLPFLTSRRRIGADATAPARCQSLQIQISARPHLERKKPSSS